MSLRERGEAAEATRAEHARQEAQRNAERRIKSLDYEDDDDPFQLDNPESKAAGRWNSKYAWVSVVGPVDDPGCLADAMI